MYHRLLLPLPFLFLTLLFYLLPLASALPNTVNATELEFVFPADDASSPSDAAIPLANDRAAPPPTGCVTRDLAHLGWDTEAHRVDAAGCYRVLDSLYQRERRRWQGSIRFVSSQRGTTYFGRKTPLIYNAGESAFHPSPNHLSCLSLMFPSPILLSVFRASCRSHFPSPTFLLND